MAFSKSANWKKTRRGFQMGRRSDFLRRCTKGASVAAAACLALTFPLASANAGFFDFLFAPQPSPQIAVPYPDQMSQRFGYHRRRPKPVALHRKIQMAKIHRSALPHLGLDFMDDDSLHNGDAVMTPSGIRIFTGSSSDRHSADDFSKLSEIKGLSSRKRAALVAIDAHLSAATEQPKDRAADAVTGRSVADAGVSEGSIITDPKGRQIRYVGP
jgi:hypothetical protein